MGNENRSGPGAVLVFPGSHESPGMVVKSPSIGELRVFMEDEIPDPENLLVFVLGGPEKGMAWFLLLPRLCCRKGAMTGLLMPQLIGSGSGLDGQVVFRGLGETWLAGLLRGRISHARLLAPDETLGKGTFFLVSPHLEALLPDQLLARDTILKHRPGLLPRTCPGPRFDAAMARAEAWMKSWKEGSGQENPVPADWSKSAKTWRQGFREEGLADLPPCWPGYPGEKGIPGIRHFLAFLVLLADLVLGVVLVQDPGTLQGESDLIAAREHRTRLERQEKQGRVQTSTEAGTGRKTLHASEILSEFQTALEKSGAPVASLRELEMEGHQTRLVLGLPGGTGLAWSRVFRNVMPHTRLVSFSANHQGLEILDFERTGEP